LQALGALRSQACVPGGIPVDLVSQRLAGNPLNFAGVHVSENELNRLSFLANTVLGLVIGEAIEAASIQVDPRHDRS
jgi:hypothetical protein